MRFWQTAAQYAFTAVLVLGPFAAEGAERARRGMYSKVCSDGRGTCNHACMAQQADRPVYVECIRQCSLGYESCRLNESSEAAEASREAVVEGNAPPVAAGALTAAEIRTLAMKLGATANQRLATNLPPVNPPECERQYGMIRNPSACLIARNKPRADARAAEQGDAPPLLAEAARSLEADLAALPSEPLAAFDAMHAINEKYQPITAYAKRVRDNTTTLRNANDPIRAAADRFESRRFEAAQHATRRPEIRQAYVENRLNIPQDMLPPRLEMYDWKIDQKTLAMQRTLKEAGKRDLFSERTVDLARSPREANESSGSAHWGEPTANEIGLAVLRVFANVEGEMKSPFESARVRGAPLAVLMLDGEQVNRLVHIEKAGACEKLASATYRCPIRQWMQIYVRGNIVGWMSDGASAPMARLWQAAFDAAEAQNGKPTTVVVQGTASGWQAPELIAELRNSDRRAREATARSIKSQRCTQQRMESPYGYMSLDCHSSF